MVTEKQTREDPLIGEGPAGLKTETPLQLGGLHSQTHSQPPDYAHKLLLLPRTTGSFKSFSVANRVEKTHAQGHTVWPGQSLRRTANYTVPDSQHKDELYYVIEENVVNLLTSFPV